MTALHPMGILRGLSIFRFSNVFQSAEICGAVAESIRDVQCKAKTMVERTLIPSAFITLLWTRIVLPQLKLETFLLLKNDITIIKKAQLYMSKTHPSETSKENLNEKLPT